MKRGLACVGFVLVTANAIAAEPCLDNFTADGNIFTGRTYKTWAIVPGVRPEEAFPRVYAFTAENGFTVVSSNKEVGVISATQSVSYGKGKTVPLSVTLREEGADTRITISYATSGGLASPEDAIKRHFCLTIAAASEKTKVPNPASAPQAGAAPPVQHSSLRGYATATSEQQQAIERAIPKTAPNERIRKLVTEASPAIAVFIERLSCLANSTGARALNEYAAPGTNFASRGYPMVNTHYHDRSACMTVLRVQGWNAPANNALRFEVVYKADDSGETVKETHEAIKQPDGVWLFTQ